MCVTLPNFMAIGQTVTEILFFDFQDSCHLPSWIFRNSKFLRPVRCRGSISVLLPNFVAIGQTGAKIWRFIYFSIWRPSVILDLLCACLDHPRCAFGGLYRCAKLGWNLLWRIRLDLTSNLPNVQPTYHLHGVITRKCLIFTTLSHKVHWVIVMSTDTVVAWWCDLQVAGSFFVRLFA